MKAILEFNLPEDRDEFTLAKDGHGWYCACLDLDNWLRGKLKHGHEFKTADEALEACRKYLNNEAMGCLSFDMVS